MGYFSNDTSQNQRTKHTTQGPPGVGFQLTQDGNYDIQDKRLTNVGSPQILTRAPNSMLIKITPKSEMMLQISTVKFLSS